MRFMAIATTGHSVPVASVDHVCVRAHQRSHLNLLRPRHGHLWKTRLAVNALVPLDFLVSVARTKQHCDALRELVKDTSRAADLRCQKMDISCVQFDTVSVAPVDSLLRWPDRANIYFVKMFGGRRLAANALFVQRRCWLR